MTALSCFLSTRISRDNASNCARGIGLRTGKRSTPGGVTGADSVISQNVTSTRMGVNRRPPSPAPLRPSFLYQAQLPAGDVEETDQHDEGDQGQPIGVGPSEEGVMVAGPRVDPGIEVGGHALHERDGNARNGTASDVAARQQYAGALVALGGQRRLIQLVLAQGPPHSVVH